MRETQRKGDIAVAKAISVFTEKGWDVSKPLTESAAYDLVVDTGIALQRVQVKYCSNENGEVGLRRIHSNSQGYVVKFMKPNSFDWLAVYHKGHIYIHDGVPDNRTAIRVSKMKKLTEETPMGVTCLESKGVSA